MIDSNGAFMELIKQKEKAYHNKAFSEGTRKKLDKYYTITQRSRIFYEACLQSNSENKTVLEYGCGPGSHAFFLARQAASVIGIDISEVAIAQATEQAKNEKLENISFCVMDAEALEMAAGTFDLICGTAILHHLDVNKAFAQIVRTLKPNGMAIFFEPLGHNPIINLYRKLTPGFRTEDEHPLLMKDIKTADSYFKQVSTHFFHLFSLAAVPFHKLAGFGRLLQFLDAIDRILFKLLPFMRKYAWIAVIMLAQPKK